MSTPDNPDNDTLEDGTHGGEGEQAASGRTPDTPDNDVVPDGETSAQTP